MNLHITGALTTVTAASRVLRDVPDLVANRVWDFAESFHRPTDLTEGDTPHPYCLRCKTNWPCLELRRLKEKRREAFQ